MQSNENPKKIGMFYFVGNVFNKGVAFLTVPIFSRILSTTDYGIVTTYNSWVAILNMVLGCALTMGIRAAFIDYKDLSKNFTSSIIRFTFKIGMVASTISILICIILNLPIKWMMVVLSCFFQGMFWAIIDDYSQYLMMTYKFKQRTFYMIAPNLLSVIISIACILYIGKDKYLGRIFPTSIVYTILGLIIVIQIMKYRDKTREKEYLKYALAISLPLVLHGVALNILSQSDRIMITWLANASETGIYSLIYNFSMIATVITTSLDGIWIPFFIEKIKANEYDEVNEKARWYIELMTIAMVGIVLVGPEIVKILAANEYWEGICIIPPIVLSNFLIFAYTLYVNIEHYHKKTSKITLYTVISAIVNIVLNFIFIPYFGYVAAAYTTLTSYAVTLFLHARNARKIENNVLQFKLFIRPLGTLVLTVVLFYLLVDCIIIRWILAILFLIYIILSNRTVINTILISRRNEKK